MEGLAPIDGSTDKFKVTLFPPSLVYNDVRTALVAQSAGAKIVIVRRLAL